MTSENQMFSGDLENLDEDDDSIEETETTRKTRKTKTKDLSDVPIENADSVPLFEGEDKRGLRTIAYLKVTKLDNPGAGYKGQIPLNSTLETIGQLYGNGIYNIEATTHNHKVLRVRENVRISLDTTKEKATEGRTSVAVNPAEYHIASLIKGANESHKLELERSHTLADKINQQVIENGKNYVEMVTRTTESAAQREREHMKGVNEQQQNFFANILASQNQGFQQLMAIMVMGHQQTIEVIKSAANQNNPLLLVETMLKGLSLGREMGDDGTPDWLKAFDKGGNMIRDLVVLAKTPNPGNTPAQLSSKNIDKESNKSEKNNKKLPLNKEELVEVVKLKKILSERGIDFTALLRQAGSHYDSLRAEDLHNPDASESSEETDETDDLENQGNPDPGATT